MSDSSSALPNGFDILQKMWEAFSPSAAFASPLTQMMQHSVPLLDPAELDKRIAEMRAVEQWLTLNANLLRSTIQTFEVQRATYATLKTFGDTFAHAAENVAAGAAPKAAPADDNPVPQSAGGQGRAEGGGGEAAASPFAQAAQIYGAFDPAQWWGALRAQFDQIAAAAQASQAAPGMASVKKDEPAGKPSAKPRARKAGKTGAGAASGETGNGKSSGKPNSQKSGEA